MVFPWEKWSQIHRQCEVNRNYRIDLDVHFQNSFGMGELNRNMSRIYACTSRTSDLNLYKGQPSLKVEIWNYKSSRWTVLDGSSFVRDVVFSFSSSFQDISRRWSRLWATFVKNQFLCTNNVAYKPLIATVARWGARSKHQPNNTQIKMVN